MVTRYEACYISGDSDKVYVDAADYDALEADAARYRWLRDNADASNGKPFIARFNGSFSRWTGVAADGIIDNAMALAPPTGEG